MTGRDLANVAQGGISNVDLATTFSNVLPGHLGDRFLVDTIGARDFRIVSHILFTGLGSLQWRIIEEPEPDNILYTSTPRTGMGEIEDDSGWTPLPEWAKRGEEIYMVLQAKSTNPLDVYLHRSLQMLLR